MEFIKKNYEKIILGAVLLGLMGALAFMPVVIHVDQQKMTDLKMGLIHPPVKPLPALDLSPEKEVLARLKSPYHLDFSTTNKLFNPVLWQRTRDGHVVKATGLGPNAAVVTKITPLYFSIGLESVMTNTLGDRYVFVVTNEAAALPALRYPRRYYVSPGEKNRVFKLNRVAGPTNAPTQLVVTLNDSGQTVTVTPSRPFQRVDSYVADVKYPPADRNFTGLRVGDHLNFAGDDYNVIAIDRNTVILLAQSNQKKYTLRYTP